MNAPEHVAGPVKIGHPGELTVLVLAKRVLALTGSQSIIKYRPLPIDDPKLRRPDVSQARELLGWQPVTDLDTGLRRTIAHFRQRLGRPARLVRPVGRTEEGRVGTECVSTLAFRWEPGH